MRGIVTGFLLFSAVGCGPGKQLPDTSAKTSATPAPESAITIPAQSDDAAKKLVEQALKATGGDQIAKVAAFRSQARGKMTRPIGERHIPLETRREFDAVWPDRVRLRLESESLKPLTLAVKRPVVWMTEGERSIPFQNPAATEGVVLTDAMGQGWMYFLYPLADPKTVVFDAGVRTEGTETHRTVKAAVPGYPLFLLTFNTAYLLTRIEYIHIESDVSYRKVMTLGEHKAFGGITQPTAVRFYRNSELVEEWTVTKWEAVEKIDDAVFTPPK